jgi:hypothetical protein
MNEIKKRQYAFRRVLFAAFILAALVGTGLGLFLGREKAIAEQRCEDDCALLGKRGVMKPSDPWWRTAGMRSTGVKSCSCE